MAILRIYEYPHPILKKKAEPVAEVNDDLRRVLDDMLETMYEAPGVGLAAPQVGLSQRMVVIDAAREDEEPAPMYLINPEIIWRSEETEICEEGCLSVPEQNAEVERPASVRVRYTDYHGQSQEILAEGFLAVVVQHELDHLNGILYIDRISKLKKSMLVKKLEKLRKEKAKEAK